MAAARNVQQQLLLVSSEAATPKAAATGTATLTATAAIAGASTGAAVTASTTSATSLSGGAETGAVVGGGATLTIGKGQSSDALRLEELKAELQAMTAAKKKVGQNVRTMVVDIDLPCATDRIYSRNQTNNSGQASDNDALKASPRTAQNVQKHRS